MPKSLYSIYAFSYFGMHAVVMDLFKFWWVVIEHIFFWHFIFIHKINYLVQQNPYHMLFGSPLDVTTICIICNMHRVNGDIISTITLTSKLIICKASIPQFLCVQNFTNMRRKVKLKREYSVTIFPNFREKRSLDFEGKENFKKFHHIWTLPLVW
jgi:hypothetical protein